MKASCMPMAEPFTSESDSADLPVEFACPPWSQGRGDGQDRCRVEAYVQARTMAANVSPLREAPPTRQPSTAGQPMMAPALVALTEPP